MGVPVHAGYLVPAEWFGLPRSGSGADLYLKRGFSMRSKARPARERVERLHSKSRALSG